MQHRTGNLNVQACLAPRSLSLPSVLPSLPFVRSFVHVFIPSHASCTHNAPPQFEATQDEEYNQDFIKPDLRRGMSFPRQKPLVAILGGSFDPITDAHLKAACEIIHSKCADEVWIIPCGARPDKPSLKTSALDRLIMCHLAVDTMFGSKFPLAVKDLELPLHQAAPTLHLVREMESRYTDKDFAFVIGTDLVAGLEQWGCAAVPEWGREAIATDVAGPLLFNRCNFIVINR